MTDTSVAESDKSLYKALAEFQSKCPPIVKDKTAKIKTDKGYTYEYRYADLATIVSTIRKAMSDAGLSFSQAITIEQENGGRGVIKTRIFHVDGGHLESIMLLPVGNLKPQDLGSYLTYYRRYALTSLAGVVAEDDDDGQIAQNAVLGQPAQETSATGSIPEMELKKIDDRIAAAGTVAELKKIVADGLAMADRYQPDGTHEKIRKAANDKLDGWKKAAELQKAHGGVIQ